MGLECAEAARAKPAGALTHEVGEVEVESDGERSDGEDAGLDRDSILDRLDLRRRDTRTHG